MESSQSWWERNEFLMRRLHSLSGLIPVGAYMTVHLLTNASINESPTAFQKNVYAIHSFGKLLPWIEWIFIFIPILFHAILGVVIIRGGLPNTQSYPYRENIRYTLQRVTGMIAFAFIAWHVFHMHGWMHASWWREVAGRFLGAQFAPYNAGSSAGEAMQTSFIIPVLYVIGVLACVYHLANGIWTMGITWGVWVSPAAQARANYVCAAFGIWLAFVGLSAVTGFSRLDVEKAYEAEELLWKAKSATGEVHDAPGKRKVPTPLTESSQQSPVSLERSPARDQSP